MRDRLIELIKHIVIPYYAEQIADYLLENGVIVPPCKVGDEIYVVDLDRIKKVKVSEISFNSDGQFYLHYFGFGYPASAIGKRLFFTREEAIKAKRALKGGAE